MKKLLILSISFALIILIGCKNENSKTNNNIDNNTNIQNTNTESENTLTQIHKNNEFKYSFKYPENWTIEESSDGFVHQLLPTIRESCGDWGEEWVCLDSIYFGVLKNDNNLEFESLLATSLGWEKDINYKNIREIDINNNKAYKILTISAFDGDASESIWIPMNSYYFRITGAYLSENQKETLEDIFSSFQLLD